jgi:hypothetical protein
LSTADDRTSSLDDEDFGKGPPDYVIVFVVMYLFFIVFFMFTIFET